MSRTRVTDEEFNLVLELTHRTKLDGVIDIASDETHDFFVDFENDNAELSLQEGFEILSDSLAYSFQEEGFDKQESDILAGCFRRFVPDFTEPDVSK